MEEEMDELVLIGVIKKVRSNKGDLKVESMSDFPERFSELKEAFVRKPGSTGAVRVEIEKSEFVNNYAVIRLKGVDSYDSAEALLGAEVLVRETDRVVPPDGTYFVDSLVDMRVVDADGSEIGIVRDVLSGPKQSILRIGMKDGREFDLPFVNAFIKNVDRDTGEITVELIEGIIEETGSGKGRHLREN